MYNTINPFDFVELSKKANINIIDIRNKNKYLIEHYPNSINIEYQELVDNPYEYLYKDDTYYLYCDKGIESIDACILLTNKNYNVISILGGYEKIKYYVNYYNT